MTTFVLVAGAWHGPWAWDRVVPLLGRAGARTIVPDLAYGRDVGLHDHVAQVVAALDAAGTGCETQHVADAHASGGVVLVGHSYAGLVVRQAADLCPERVDHVIMVEGWAGADGDSMFSLAPEGFVKFVQESAEFTGQGPSGRTSGRSSPDGWQVPAPAPALFGITDPDDAQWLQERLRPQPLRTFAEGTRLSGVVDRIPGTAVYCRPQTFAFDRFAEAVGYRTVALDGAHDVMLTDPGAVADVLLSVRFRNRKLEA